MLLLVRVTLVDELIDDPPEGEQTRIDHASFARSRVGRAGPPDVLGPGEVDEVEFADLEDVGAFFRVVADLDIDRKDRMRATCRGDDDSPESIVG